MDKHSSIGDLISQILAILGVNDAGRRQNMISEVEQMTQAHAMQLALRKLPEDVKKSLGDMPQDKLEAVIKKHITEKVAQDALEAAAEEILPRYIAELTQTATPEQRQAIEKLLP